MKTIDDIQIFIMTYNRVDFLKESIESILNQSVKVKELIILDNESTDNTKELVESYANRGVKYIRTSGFLGNYYKAKEIADKKYCMLFHDDDILHPNYLEFALKVLNKHKNVSLVVTRFYDFYNNFFFKHKKAYLFYSLFESQKEFAEFMYFVENVAYPNAIYRTEDFKKIDLEYEKYSKFNDWPLMLKMAAFGKVVLLEDSKLLAYRIHMNQDTNTTTNTLSLEQAINWVKVFNDFGEFDKDSEIYKIFLNKADYFLRGRYDLYIDKELKKDFTYSDLLDFAEKKGIVGIKNAQGESYIKTDEYKRFFKKIANKYRYNKLMYWFYNLKNLSIKQNLNEKDWIKYFKKNDEQEYINKIVEKLKDKKIVLYGYGIIGKLLLDKYDLSKLNIVAISDAKFSNIENHKIKNYIAVSPEKLCDMDYDIILSALKTDKPIFNFLNKNNIKKNVISLIVK